MLLFLDTETTGKDENARLVQLCMKLEGSDAEEFLFKPPIPITFEAMATHHITEKMVESLPEIEIGNATFNYIQSRLDNNILVAHNAPFDIAIMEREGFKVGKFIDTLKIAQTFWDEPIYKLQYFRYKFGFEIDATAHDAVGDVLVLERLYNYMFKVSFDNLGLMTPEKFIDWAIDISSKPLLIRYMPFGKHKGKKMSEMPKDYLLWLKGQSELGEDMVFTLEHYLKPTNPGFPF